MADPYEDGFSDLLIKKQKMIELEKKVWSSVSVKAMQNILLIRRTLKKLKNFRNFQVVP